MVLTRRFKILCALAIAVGVYIVLSGPSQDTTPIAAPAERGPRAVSTVAAPSAAARSAVPTGTASGGNLLTRLAHRVAESKAVEALFHTQSWYVAPPPPPPAPVVVVAPPPPTAPPLPFTVMGSYTRPGDPTVYFLTRGDRVFDVHIGDTIDNTYSVDGEANGELVLTYKPLNIKQALALGGTQ